MDAIKRIGILVVIATASLSMFGCELLVQPETEKEIVYVEVPGETVYVDVPAESEPPNEIPTEILESIMKDGEAVVAMRVMNTDRDISLTDDVDSREYFVDHPIRVGLLFKAPEGLCDADGNCDYKEDSLMIGLAEKQAAGVADESHRIPDLTCFLGGFKAVYNTISVTPPVEDPTTSPGGVTDPLAPDPEDTEVDPDETQGGEADELEIQQQTIIVVYFEQEFRVPSECLSDGAGGSVNIREFNMWVGINPAVVENVADGDEVHEDDFNTAFYTEYWQSLGDDSESNRCFLLTDSEVLAIADDSQGCVVDLTVEPSPGVDIDLDKFVIDSSVAVMPTPVTAGVPDSVRYPKFMEGQLQAQFNGAFTEYDPETQDPPDDLSIYLEAEAAGEPVVISFYVCPSSSINPEACDGSTTWQELMVLNPDGEENALDYALPVTGMQALTRTLFPFELYVDRSADLFAYLNGVDYVYTASDTTVNLDPAGLEDWSGYDLFTLRACLELPAGFIEDEANKMNIDTTANNCSFENVVITPPNVDSQSANSWSYNYSQGSGFGNSVVGLSYSIWTNNNVNLSGATTDNGAKVDLTGWLGANIIHIWGKAAAYVSLVGSYYDLGVKVVGINLWTKSQVVPEFHWSYTKLSWSKSVCARYTYGIAGFGLNAEICASGEAGITPAVDVVAVEGNNTNFPDTSRVGEASVTITPYANFGLTASLYADLLIANGGIAASVTIVGVAAPLRGYMQWGLVAGTTYPNLKIVPGVTFTPTITLLSGLVYVWVDVWTPAWCSCGSWCPGYPCSDWSRVAYEVLVQWSGWTYAWNYGWSWPIQTLF